MRTPRSKAMGAYLRVSCGEPGLCGAAQTRAVFRITVLNVSHTPSRYRPAVGGGIGRDRRVLQLLNKKWRGTVLWPEFAAPACKLGSFNFPQISGPAHPAWLKLSAFLFRLLPESLSAFRCSIRCCPGNDAARWTRATGRIAKSSEFSTLSNRLGDCGANSRVACFDFETTTSSWWDRITLKKRGSTLK